MADTPDRPWAEGPGARPDRVDTSVRSHRAARPGLVPEPPGRQGPGETGGPAVAALDLGLAPRSGGRMPGDHRSAGLGAGTELAQLRPYAEGDDVRHLDAAATARTGEPHVRVHVPERTLTTWVLLDVSAGMAFGTTTRLKSDVAEGAARVVCRLGVRRGGRVGLVRFGGPRMPVLPPRGGRVALGAIEGALSEGVAGDNITADEDLGTALGHLRLVARRPGMAVVISDFRDEEPWARKLAAVADQHRTTVVEIYDPREEELPDAGMLVVRDPESGRHVEVDTSSKRLRDAYARVESERRATVAAEIRRARAAHIRISTDGDWLRELAKGLRG